MNSKVEYKIATGEMADDVVMRMVAGDKRGREAKLQLESFMNFIRRYRIDVSRQPVALTGRQIVGYALVLVSPGASASVFLPEEKLSSKTKPEFRKITTELLKFLAGQIETWDMGLIQTVMEDKTSEIHKLFLAGGFSDLCDLEIMEAAVSIDRCMETDEKIEWVSFSPETEKRFERVILQSYEGSRDCPKLSGLRTGSEILEGHRYSGFFELKGWWLMQYEGKDAGMVLLNSTEQDLNRLELIYMGLARWARGLGLGKVLLSRAFEAAGMLDKKILRLAVDRQNEPAIKLYQKFGFTPVSRQSVLAVMNEARRKRIAEHVE
jgi:ribosomal protein S18 acetylase RimI-like enzyme